MRDGICFASEEVCGGWLTDRQACRHQPGIFFLIENGQLSDARGSVARPRLEVGMRPFKDHPTVKVQLESGGHRQADFIQMRRILDDNVFVSPCDRLEILGPIGDFTGKPAQLLILVYMRNQARAMSGSACGRFRLRVEPGHNIEKVWWTERPIRGGQLAPEPQLSSNAAAKCRRHGQPG